MILFYTNLSLLLDKFIVAALGIASALITDYVTKRKREKKQNIEDGKHELKITYNRKIKNPEDCLDYILPNNPDFITYLSHKKYDTLKIEEKIKKPYETKKKAEEELEFIKAIYNK